MVEVLAAVVILGIAGVAVMVGLMMAVKASDIHRKETTGSAYVRGYAEAIQKYISSADSHYQPCANADWYTPARVNFDSDLPSGYTASQSTALSVVQTGATATCVAGNDTGLQEMTLGVASNDGRAKESLTIVVRRACSTYVGAGGDPCS